MPDTPAALAPLLETVLQLVPDAAVVVDGRGEIVLTNGRADDLFGYGPGELVGQAVEVLVPERYRRVHEAQRTTFLGDPHLRPMGAGLDLYGRRKDGSELPVDISLAPITSDGRGLAVAAIRDVTERRAIEAELRRLLATSERHARWQEASAEIRLAGLRGEPLDRVLDLVARRTGELVGSSAVVLVSGRGEVIAGAGAGDGLVGTVGDRPVLGAAAEARTCPRAELGVAWADHLKGPEVVVAPVRTARDEVSALLVCDAPADAAIGPEDLAVVRSMAQQAATAVDLEQSRADEEALLLADERGRIARDLHDHAVQGLFATGLGLQSVLPLVDNPRAIERVQEAIDSLDEAIKQIRTAIFTLTSPSAPKVGLRAEVVRVAGEASRALGFDPAVVFDGPVDVGVPPEVATHVVAVLREALANVARHARASSVSVELRATPERCELRVSDDGVGLATGARGAGNGLVNLASRAESLGGALEVDSAPGAGTRLTWRVPLA